jgi:hypothetical protein
MREDEGAPSRTIDKVLLSLDKGAFGAHYRVLIGCPSFP